MVRPLLLFALVAWSATAQSFEAPAVQISKEIQARHLPFGTILSPVYPSAESDQIVSYTRCGDSAIWTGHYLAAESFRYAVTGSAEALAAARTALRGVQSLVEVTGSSGLLARCVLPVGGSLSNDPRNEEKQHGEYTGTIGGSPYYWIGNTSRDQYLGVFFGLSVAYDHLPDDRAAIRGCVTTLIDRLLAKSWAVIMPDGDISTVFWLRPDQELSILQVGRQVNPQRYASAYEELRRNASGIGTAISFETLDDHGSYFKFNLDAIALYDLLRLEEESARRGDYMSIYRSFRSAVANHGNAFFNVIDRALIGPNGQRDSETIRLMAQWLERPRRDFYVDLRSKYKVCGDDKACDPLPVAHRVRTDFLWQRSPYLLYGGGSGRIENAGIDFILPYWMGRFYGLDFAPLAASAASGETTLAPDSIASLFGAGMPATGAQVSVVDSTGTSRRTPVIFFSSGQQINFLIPAGTALGSARIVVQDASGTVTSSSAAKVERVAPALFTASANGKGVASALAVRVERDGSHTDVPVGRCSGPLLCVAERIEVSDDRPVFLSLYGTGIRGGDAVSAHIGGVAVPVTYAGPQGQYAGLDQVNLRLTGSLQGKGETDLVLTVDGAAANTVRIGIR